MHALPPATLFTRATRQEFSLFMSTYVSAFTINPIRQVVMTRDPQAGFGPFNRQRYSNPAVDAPALAALTAMDPERREILTHQAARALLEDKGVIPIVFLKNAWAGWRNRVTYHQDVFNRTTAQSTRPVN